MKCRDDILGHISLCHKIICNKNPYRNSLWMAIFIVNKRTENEFGIEPGQKRVTHLCEFRLPNPGSWIFTKGRLNASKHSHNSRCDGMLIRGFCWPENIEQTTGRKWCFWLSVLIIRLCLKLHKKTQLALLWQKVQNAIYTRVDIYKG